VREGALPKKKKPIPFFKKNWKPPQGRIRKGYRTKGFGHPGATSAARDQARRGGEVIPR